MQRKDPDFFKSEFRGCTEKNQVVPIYPFDLNTEISDEYERVTGLESVIKEYSVVFCIKKGEV